MTNDPIQQNQEMQSTKDEQLDNAYTQIEQLKKQARLSESHFERVCKENAELKAQLAECYKLSGADPDGDTDAHLAKYAVQEVRTMRERYDEMEAQLATAGTK